MEIYNSDFAYLYYTVLITFYKQHEVLAFTQIISVGL